MKSYRLKLTFATNDGPHFMFVGGWRYESELPLLLKLRDAIAKLPKSEGVEAEIEEDTL